MRNLIFFFYYFIFFQVIKEAYGVQMDSYIRSPNEALSPPGNCLLLFLMSISTSLYWNATSIVRTRHIIDGLRVLHVRPSHYTVAPPKKEGEKLVKTYTCLYAIYAHTPQLFPDRQRWGNVWDVERGQNISKSSLSMFIYIYILLYILPIIK